MESKSDAVRRLVAAGQYKEALRIAKGFRRGITKDDSEAMQRGYECLLHASFYESIGYNPSEIAHKGIATVSRLFGPQLTSGTKYPQNSFRGLSRGLFFSRIVGDQHGKNEKAAR